MENELLPCPFCGASARILFTNDGDMYGPDCDHKNGCLIHSIDFLEYATREDAIKDWNRRAVVNDSLTTCKDDLQVDRPQPATKPDAGLTTRRGGMIYIAYKRRGKKRRFTTV